MATWRSRQRTNLIALFCVVLFVWVFYGETLFPPENQSPNIKTASRPEVRPEARPEPPAKPETPSRPETESTPKKSTENDVEMVVASMKKENTTWLYDYLLDWKKNIYVVDDPTAALTVPVNKGREAMVFLTYIIDRYDSLPGNIIFHHAERFQWHNDNVDYDALPLLQRLRFDYLKEQGYANLRCVWVLGCPVEIHPIKDDVPGKKGEPVHAKRAYKKAYEELFPEFPVPEAIGVTCCSQFAVRRETIWKRPKADYERYRDWLVTSPLGDDISGRVLEYSWHMIFGKKAVHCPAAGQCYCRLYGLCDLDCEQDECEGQYYLPPFSTLPRGWPMIGWNKEDRNWHGPP
ncbi:unnamed protein product [Clonostachys rosea]|uniref:Uncharacterized protein n=1 Tax=Bionectria ochroleuca TaxID=29856 RepID=A0ABY6TPW4_BIOOC|nr:unnamed protein product [Clonostachys rosea]